ncbi:DUF2787 family protein [Vibrio astriarenae]
MSAETNMMPFASSVIPVSEKMHRAIVKAISNSEQNTDNSSLTINFRDSTYDAERGGYHPVKIRIQRDEVQQWHLCYITDFAFSGGPHPELGIELDFNFEQNSFKQMYLSPSPLNSREVVEFYKVWESNFLEYLTDGAFDQIEVSA